MDQINNSVIARLRPFLDDDTSNKCISHFQGNTVIIEKQDMYSQTFQFSRALDTSVDQEAVFLQIALPLITGCLSGRNGTLLFYGSQESGKTYSIFGTTGSLFSIRNELISADCGVFFRVTKLLVDRMNSFSLKILMVENEKIQILYKLESNIHSWNELSKKLYDVVKNVMDRKSHLIIEYGCCVNKIPDASIFRVVQISSIQKNNQTNNRTLFTLHRCISVMIEQQNSKKLVLSQYVPVRESKLTNLLADCLSGHTQMQVILCISPINYDEGIGTLIFGQQLQQLYQINVNNVPNIANSIRHQSLLSQQKHDILKVQQLDQSNMIQSAQNPDYMPIALHKLRMQEVTDKYETIIEYLQSKIVKYSK